MFTLDTIIHGIMTIYFCLAVMMFVLCLASIPVVIYGLIFLFKEDEKNGSSEKV